MLLFHAVLLVFLRDIDLVIAGVVVAALELTDFTLIDLHQRGGRRSIWRVFSLRFQHLTWHEHVSVHCSLLSILRFLTLYTTSSLDPSLALTLHLPSADQDHQCPAPALLLPHF